MKYAALLFASFALGAAAQLKASTAADIVTGSPPADWQPVSPDNLVLIDLADGSEIAMMLAPDFAPAHVANIRALVRAGWFDGGSVYRVDDNYVVQWGQADSGKTVPSGLDATLTAEFDRERKGIEFTALPYPDSFAREAGYSGAFPVARDANRTWIAHCRGIVGAARGLTNSGTGTELYAVIGESPRRLDRNAALVGRIVDGFPHIAALPRGTGVKGTYEKPEQRTTITKTVLAVDLAEARRPSFEWLRPGTRTFRLWLDATANHSDAFLVRAAGAVDLCRGMPPVRPISR